MFVLARREGCLLFEVANALGPRKHDWPNKIQVALSQLELAEVVTDRDRERGNKVVHDTCEWCRDGHEWLLLLAASHVYACGCAQPWVIQCWIAAKLLFLCMAFH